ncbi:glycosyltransferase family 61 protein [Adhaeribacter swui]|uniref:Glycosyltransferase family 61 protein n=1 Tax=Adhaeribacter swui TaxID=2086471 RepID=A0A7G7GAL1_9BACT|nr:glycosyltransferase family 61 protein [Adhaeribacter swui]QNF34195.1 glycosyltransferase family 61 protein [Adhaeribacter swui]
MSLRKIVYQFLSWINYYYFPTSLAPESKDVYLERYKVNFTPEEIEFLKKSAATFNYATDYADVYWQKALYTVKLSQVTLLGNSGALVKQEKVISDSTFDQVRLCLSPAYRSPAFMRKRRKTGLYTSIFHLPWAQTSNYHWFYDCLPRLYPLLQQVKDPIQLIVNKDIPAFQLQTLQFVIKDYPHFSITFQSKNEKWELEHYIFPGFTTNHISGYLPAEVAHFLRNKIWQGYQVQALPAKNRIYISRSKARKRRVINEAELIKALIPYNFQVIYAEDLTYAQQVQIFYQAAIVVAPHGAGLTNLLFSEQCSVMELHPVNIIKPHYFLAAKALNFNYDYVLGSNADNNLDFEVRVEQVLAVVSKKLN